jgi:hypothetical protein
MIQEDMVAKANQVVVAEDIQIMAVVLVVEAMALEEEVVVTEVGAAAMVRNNRFLHHYETSIGNC